MDQKTIARAIARLPTPSGAIRHISMVIRNKEASASDVADALRLDPVLLGKTLRLANSAYIGMPRTVSSLQYAIVLLGIKRIHALLLTSELLAPFSNSTSLPFSLDAFRRHAVTVAFIAESIARHLKRYNALDEHEIFSGALLHDIGKLLAADIFRDEVIGTLARCAAMELPFYRAEGSDYAHTRLGVLLAQQWHFPPDLAACIGNHHGPACAAPEYHRIVSIIHIADIMAHLLDRATIADEVAPHIDEAALRAVELPVERLRVIAVDILKQQDQIDSLLAALV